MSKPDLSIIVPIYNAEKELQRCLDSLISQTFRNIEIVCVIDGSPDSSLEICRRFEKIDPRIVIVSQDNKGPAGARNTGLLNAKGVYIQFCDPDDYYMPEMCGKLYNAITLSGADLAVAGIQVFYEQLSTFRSEREYFRIKCNGLINVNEVIFRNTDVSVCNKIFKKSIIDTYRLEFFQSHNYEDACFFYKYLFVSKTIFYVSEYLYSYIRHDNSIMSNTFQKNSIALDHVKILEDIACFMNNYNLKGRYETDIFLWIIITSVHFAIIYGIESIYESIAKIVSPLLAHIHDEIILSCPYISKIDANKLIALKRNNIKLFFEVED